MLRAGRGFSLLLTGKRGTGGHAVQPAPHAPVTLAHAARGHDTVTRGATRLRWHADARAGTAGAGAAAPAQHPSGLPPGAARRTHRAGRASAPAAARIIAACRQRHPVLLRV